MQHIEKKKSCDVQKSLIQSKNKKIQHKIKLKQKKQY